IITKSRVRGVVLRSVSRHAEPEAIGLSLAVTTPAQTRYYVTVETCITYCGWQLSIREAPASDRFGGCGSILGTNDIYHCGHSVFPATGEYRRKGVVVILRWFYIMENTNAPGPKLKVNRVHKTEMSPE
ncbi:hypothetical protein IW261DRAFT_1341769, partial [Armillaria novae-zelandiae]